MIVTSKIKLDMAQPGTANPVFVVQGDGNTRAVEADLLANGSSWAPDDGWDAAITYRKPDGTKGLYNLLEDGSSAITISGSTATVILASQMLTEPGTVRAAIVFTNQRLDQLTSFPFLVSVARNQFAGAQQSEDYIRLQWLEDKLEEYLRKAADSGAFDGAPGADGHTPVYGVDYGTPEQIAGIANQAAEILQPEVNQIKDDLADLAPAGASVGQIFRVAAVGDDGKYTMEPVDMPSGEAAWKKLVDVTTEEDASRFTFTFEEVSELIVMISGIATARRVNFYSAGMTNFYHYTFLIQSALCSNYMHIHKRLGGMRYVACGYVTDETPDVSSAYTLIHDTSSGKLVNSANDIINNLNFDINTSYVLQSGARIQIFGR